MRRRAVIVGALATLTAGCTDRIHDVAATTPGDVDVTSRYVDGDPLVDDHGVEGQPEGMETYAGSFRSHDEAAAVVDADVEAASAFVDRTEFVDDGGRSILLVVQRLTTPSIDLRLGSISRIGDHALRVAVDEVGHVDDEGPVVQTLFLRLVDERGVPERVTVSVDGDRASVTV